MVEVGVGVDASALRRWVDGWMDDLLSGEVTSCGFALQCLSVGWFDSSKAFLRVEVSGGGVVVVVVVVV